MNNDDSTVYEKLFCETFTVVKYVGPLDLPRHMLTCGVVGLE